MAASKYDNDSLPEAILQYVHPYLWNDAYLRTYSGIIHSIPQSTNWVHNLVDNLSPPKYKRQAGRPTKRRRHEEGESPLRNIYGPVTCRVCHSKGHNKRTCPKNPSNETNGDAFGSTLIALRQPDVVCIIAHKLLLTCIVLVLNKFWMAFKMQRMATIGTTTKNASTSTSKPISNKGKIKIAILIYYMSLLC